MEQHRRILIIDDEAMLLNNLTDATRAEGYEVDCAAEGRSALGLLEKNRYDLVVTDLKMPYLDGMSVMEHLKGMTPTPCVIVITGYASLESAVECLRKGASDFLIKPFEVEDYLESVRKVLSRAPAPAHRDPDWAAVETRYGLTSRQCEILKAFYKTGKSNRELADDLYLSQHTVKSHLKASFEKIGVTSRAQLLKVLLEAEQ